MNPKDLINFEAHPTLRKAYALHGHQVDLLTVEWVRDRQTHIANRVTLEDFIVSGLVDQGLLQHGADGIQLGAGR